MCAVVDLGHRQIGNERFKKRSERRPGVTSLIREEKGAEKNLTFARYGLAPSVLQKFSGPERKMQRITFLLGIQLSALRFLLAEASPTQKQKGAETSSPPLQHPI